MRQNECLVDFCVGYKASPCIQFPAQSYILSSITQFKMHINTSFPSDRKCTLDGHLCLTENARWMDICVWHKVHAGRTFVSDRKCTHIKKEAFASFPILIEVQLLQLRLLFFFLFWLFLYIHLFCQHIFQLIRLTFFQVNLRCFR